MPEFIPFLNRDQTPVYIYDTCILDETITALKQAIPDRRYRVHYAVKANPNPIVMQPIAKAGLGADCVSGGEIALALGMGIPAGRIFYAGVGKTDCEIAYALHYNIRCFNVESIEELQVISEIAEKMNKKARVALRVNPNIDAHTHHYITTGLEENKFGIDLSLLSDAVELAPKLPAIELCGLHFHIGSQITIMEPFKLLCEKINELTASFKSKGITFKTINVGGGLGINYERPTQVPDFKEYFATFKKHLRLGSNQTLHFELGRAIVGQCGSIMTKVLYVKEGVGKKFVIVDAGMNDLIRPALYQAHHEIENISNPMAPKERYDVVGPVCESADVFGKDVLLAKVQRGDYLEILSAGAYGESMASTYNCRRPISGVPLNPFDPSMFG